MPKGFKTGHVGQLKPELYETMNKHDPRTWLNQQVETAVQLSDRPPKIAVWGVVLRLPGDILETLKEQSAVYEFSGYWWFDYKEDGTTVCIPIQIT